MNARRVSVWGMFATLAAPAVFSFMGDRLVFWLYAGLLVPVVAFHWSFGCHRCTNLACAVNPASEDFFLGGRKREPRTDVEYSDLQSSIPGIPLVLVVGLGLYGSWTYQLWAFLACGAVLVGSIALYSRATCAHCANKCPNNRNPEYRDWKSKVAGSEG